MTREKALQKIVEKYGHFRLPERFPGDVRLLDILPHLGEMLLDFAGLYRDVRLVPVLPKDMREGSQRAFMAIYRGDEVLIESRDSPISMAFQGFSPGKLEVSHVDIGKTIDQVTGPERRFLKNGMQRTLDGHTFYLQIGNGSKESLLVDYESPYFSWEDETFRVGMNLIMIEGGTANPNLRGDFNSLELRWSQLLGTGVYKETFDIALKWRKNWEDAIKLADGGMSIDCTKSWAGCREEINNAIARLVLVSCESETD